MRWRHLVAILAFLRVVAMTASQMCPQSCQCPPSTQGSTALCREQMLTEAPSDLPDDLVVLDLGGNNFPVLSSSNVPALNSLQSLAMDNCDVAELRDSAFSALPNLQNLTLSHNKITAIHATAFRNTKLQYLYMDTNLITALPDFVFRGLNLVDLYLENNRIGELTNGAFIGCTVENLNLNNNNLSFLSGPVISQLAPNIRTFELSGNQVPLTIDRLAFQGLTLDSLLLASSQLTDHYFLEYVTSTVVDISDNPFFSLDFSTYRSLGNTESFYARRLDVEFLEARMLSVLTNLRLLNLASNNVIIVRGRAFRHMPLLETLDLSLNPFMSLPNDLGAYLPHLRALLLRNCHIMALSPTTFQGMSDITILDLRNNKIQVLPETLAPVMTAVGARLQLDNNPFHCNCQMRWFREWAVDQPFITGAERCVSPNPSLLLETPLEDFICTKPVIVESPDVVKVMPGDNITLSCRARSDPAPEVEWIAPSGEVIRISPPANRTQYDTTAIWGLKLVDSRHEGRYTCNAMNIEGLATASTVLRLVSPTTTSTTVSTTVTTTAESNLTTEYNITTVPATTPRSTTWLNVSTTIVTTTTMGYDDGYGGRVYIYAVAAVGGILLLSVIVIIFYCFLHSKLYKRTYDVNEPKPGQLKELHPRHLSTNHDVIRPQEHNQLLSQV